jgi:putative Ca2+/H+ antiporter (TMEM165/GDT1 family)
MDSLMAALVAALLIRATDPSAELVATAAERSGRTTSVLLGMLIALIVTHSAAAAAGFFIGPHLAPNAQRLFLAFALLAAASGAIWPGKTKPVEAVRRPLLSVAMRLVVGGWTGRSEFVTFAVAVGGTAALAGFGGLIGSFVVLAAAAVAGETLWGARPRRAIDWTIGGVLAIAGAWLALSALRLI